MKGCEIINNNHQIVVEKVVRMEVFDETSPFFFFFGADDKA